jgi:transcriptional regulator with XRE-family HTH domain
MSVIERFIILRKNLTKRQGYFAELMETNQQSISDIERGKKKIPFEILEKLAGFDVNINWLITGAGQKFLNETLQTANEDPPAYQTESLTELKNKIDLIEKRIRIIELKLKIR